MKFIFTFLALAIFSFNSVAQDELLDLLEAQPADKQEFAQATFKGTRLINGHSVETRQKNVMDFIISHRFGTIDGGAYTLFGLDVADIRIGLDYGITDRLSVGLGRNSYEKTFDGYAKYRLFWQSTGSKTVPVSVTLLSSMAIKTLKMGLDFTQKTAYTHQLLIARKFSPKVSIQVMPSWVHFNYIAATDLNNEVFAVGVGGRYKFSPRVAFCAEYYYQAQTLNANTHDALAVGVDIETGGHVFQLQFTNATSMVPKGFIAETGNNFFDSEIHFGFNISRTFQMK